MLENEFTHNPKTKVITKTETRKSTLNACAFLLLKNLKNISGTNPRNQDSISSHVRPENYLPGILLVFLGQAGKHYRFFGIRRVFHICLERQENGFSFGRNEA